MVGRFFLMLKTIDLEAAVEPLSDPKPNIDSKVNRKVNQQIQICFFKGTIKHSLYLGETDGAGASIDVAGSFLVRF